MVLLNFEPNTFSGVSGLDKEKQPTDGKSRIVSRSLPQNQTSGLGLQTPEKVKRPVCWFKDTLEVHHKTCSHCWKTSPHFKTVLMESSQTQRELCRNEGATKQRRTEHQNYVKVLWLLHRKVPPQMGFRFHRRLNLLTVSLFCSVSVFLVDEYVKLWFLLTIHRSVCEKSLNCQSSKRLQMFRSS